MCDNPWEAKHSCRAYSHDACSTLAKSLPRPVAQVGNAVECRPDACMMLRSPASAATTPSAADAAPSDASTPPATSAAATPCLDGLPAVQPSCVGTRTPLALAWTQSSCWFCLHCRPAALVLRSVLQPLILSAVQSSRGADLKRLPSHNTMSACV